MKAEHGMYDKKFQGIAHPLARPGERRKFGNAGDTYVISESRNPGFLARFKLEAGVGIEPAYTDLQSAA